MNEPDTTSAESGREDRAERLASAWARLRPLAPWAALVVLLVLVLPAASFVRNRMAPPVQPGVEREWGEVKSGGMPYGVERLFSLTAGQGSREVALSEDVDGAASSTLEMVAPTPDGTAIWIADHPAGPPGARVRLFSREGELLSTFRTPAGTTMFTPGFDSDLWVVRAAGATKTETLLHYSRAGKLLGSYPMLEGLFARAVCPSPSGAVWVLSEEWLLDPATYRAQYSGTLVPIVGEDGAAVESPADGAVEGTFVGYDGRIYSLKGGADKDSQEYPPFEIVATDPKTGATEKYETAGGVRPYLADADGRVYAETERPDSPDSPGIAILGDTAVPPVTAVVLDATGVVSTLPVALPPTVSPWAPAAWPDARGRLLAATWTGTGELAVSRLEPATRTAAAVAGEAKTLPAAQVLVPMPAPYSGDPYLAGDDAQRDFWQLVYAGLLSRDASLAAVPDLAVAVPKPGAGVSADGRTITWQIADDRTWHDGSPVTADDVVATWEYLRKPSSVSRPTPFLGFELIESVRADGDHVVVRLSEPFGVAPEAFFPYVLPARVVRDVATANSGLFAAPLGAGPFRVVRWEADGTMILERHAGGGEGRTPQLASLAVEFVDRPDLATAYMSSPVPAVATWLLPGDRQTVTRDAVGELVAAETGRWVGMVFNVRHEATRDPRVRRALEMAHPSATAWRVNGPSDRDATVGPFQGARQPVDPGRLESDPSTKAATALIDAAGWSTRDKHGFRRRGTTATEFEYSLAARDGYPHEIPVEVFEPVVKRWSSMGLLARWANSTRGFYSAPWDGGYLSRMRHSVGAGVFRMPPDPGWGSVFDPADAPSWSNPDGIAVTGTTDLQLRELHTRARRSYDAEERAELGRAIAKRVRELRLAVVEYPQERHAGVLGIEGYRPGPYPAGDFWNAAQWEVAAPE